MKKMFLVSLTLFVSVMYTKANFHPPKSGVGFLNADWKGRIDAEQAKAILKGVVSNDQEIMSQYIRNVSYFPPQMIRGTILATCANAVGRSSVSEAEALEIIDDFRAMRITQNDWTANGWESGYIVVNEARLNSWVPDRAEEVLLFYGDMPVFSVYCLNPIRVTTVTPLPDADIEYEPQPKPTNRLSQYPNYQPQGQTGGYMPYVNNTTVTVTNPAPQQPTVIEQRGGGNGALWALGGALAGYLVGRIVPRQQQFYSQQAGYYPQRNYYPQQRHRSNYSWNYGGGGGGYYQPQPVPKRYNTSSLSANLPNW